MDLPPYRRRWTRHQVNHQGPRAIPVPAKSLDHDFETQICCRGSEPVKVANAQPALKPWPGMHHRLEPGLPSAIVIGFDCRAPRVAVLPFDLENARERFNRLAGRIDGEHQGRSVWIVCNRQTVALGNWERHSVALPATMPSERTSWPAPAPRIDRAPNPDHRSGFSSFCSEAVRPFRGIFSGGIQVEQGFEPRPGQPVPAMSALV